MHVTLAPHNPAWAQAFAREADTLHRALGTGCPTTLHHIGSTAIRGILAKPIIDMLGVVADLETLDRHGSALASLGYEALGAFGIEGRRYFRKCDAQGRRSHHLHVFATGSPHIDRHLAFRDYLRAHPEVATAYSALKDRITAGTGTTWDSYRDAKAPFVAETERRALAWARRTAIG
jgi:GrpB-like predicted nucleotidyltransferase (UPF0157 family)